MPVLIYKIQVSYFYKSMIAIKLFTNVTFLMLNTIICPFKIPEKNILKIMILSRFSDTFACIMKSQPESENQTKNRRT